MRAVSTLSETQKVRDTIACLSCSNNLKQMALVLHSCAKYSGGTETR